MTNKSNHVLFGGVGPAGLRNGFLIPIFKRVTSDALFEQVVGKEGLVERYEQIKLVPRDILLVPERDAPLGVPETWIFAFTGLDLVVGRGEDGKGELRSRMADVLFLEKPLLAMEVAEFLHENARWIEFATLAYKKLRHNLGLRAFRWRDIEVLTPSIRRDLKENCHTLPRCLLSRIVVTTDEELVRVRGIPNYTSEDVKSEVTERVKKVLLDLSGIYDAPDAGWDLRIDARDDSDTSGWIRTIPGLPYFVKGDRSNWLPIGHNDSLSWPELAGLYRRRDVSAVEQHLRSLRSQGINCLRLPLESAQGQHRYIERPVGTFTPNMVRLWDDLFALCERVGLHILLTPYDTFFMWTRWQHHPYNRKNGGPCASRREWLTSAGTRQAIKARLAFASERWGRSPALFAWDIWNEIHPAHGGDDPAAIIPFIDDIAPWLRRFEEERHGRAHLQTVSIFRPELLRHPELTEPVFRHPALDFANIHLYQHGTIDDPRDTVAPALSVGELMRAALRETNDGRPVFDSEHGPIHRFKDKKRMLAEPFDDEYFRHIQWSHLASGGAGGGMRWPNRHPHVLTAGMRGAQRSLAAFLPLIDWGRLRRRNLNEEVEVSVPGVARFGCGDTEQAIVWLLRTDTVNLRRSAGKGMLSGRVEPLALEVAVPGLRRGQYSTTLFDTKAGTPVQVGTSICDGAAPLVVGIPSLITDIVIAIRRLDDNRADL